ncbi:MAG: valine--tRNA ligase, partial [Erysipelotrichia bacterium]|nr:valine--tRNA ligase [Erysipelotrichia bacterium]
TMVTGYDIIFFWVARMAFQARYFTHERPFKDVLIHGLIRDAEGRKMSKSLGNGIDPMKVIDEYGVDSLRFFLTTNSTPGQDMRYIPEKVDAAWNYINKIWNASRFVIMNLPDEMGMNDTDLSHLSPADAWILTRLNQVIADVTENMEKYEFALVGNELYAFVWDDFCSWYVEMSKASLNSNDETVKKAAESVLLIVLNAIVRLLHPFMPFVTEEIYLKLPHCKESICLEAWPKQISGIPSSDIAGMERMISIIKKIREVKVSNDLKPSAPLTVMVKDLNGNVVIPDVNLAAMMERMAKSIWVDHLEGDLSVQTVANGSLYIPSEQLLDKKAEIQKLSAEQTRLEQEVSRSTHILSNQGFIAKAPKEKIDIEKHKLEDYQKQLGIITARLAELIK